MNLQHFRCNHIIRKLCCIKNTGQVSLFASRPPDESLVTSGLRGDAQYGCGSFPWCFGSHWAEELFGLFLISKASGLRSHTPTSKSYTLLSERFPLCLKGGQARAGFKAKPSFTFANTNHGWGSKEVLSPLGRVLIYLSFSSWAKSCSCSGG